MNTTKTILLAGGVALAVSLMVGGLPNAKIAGSNNQLAAAISSVGGGEIRVGYIPYPPEALIKDPNTGTLSGICHDVIEEAGKNLGIKINWSEETTYATMIEGLKAGRYDLVACVWSNSERAKNADFTVPIFYNAVGAYARAGNSRFTNLNNINNKNVTIATIDGEASAYIAKTKFPNAKTISLPQDTQVSQVLLDVKTGKADITFADTSVADDFLAQNPGSIHAVAPNNPVAVFPTTFILAQNQQVFKTAFNTAIEELIDNGTVGAIVHKYQKYSDSIYPVAKPYSPPQ